MIIFPYFFYFSFLSEGALPNTNFNWLFQSFSRNVPSYEERRCERQIYICIHRVLTENEKTNGLNVRGTQPLFSVKKSVRRGKYCLYLKTAKNY